MKTTTKTKLTVLNNAIDLGFEMPSINAFEKAKEFLYDNMPPVEIEADALNKNRLSQHMRCILPSGFEWWIDGELFLNRKTGRFEEMAQDVDGKMYLVYRINH